MELRPDKLIQMDCAMPDAVSNPGVMLINNTAAARRFFRTVRVLKDDPKRMDEVCKFLSGVTHLPLART